MKQLTCEMCGGTDLIKQDGLFVCQACGTKYSVEDAKKLMVEIDGPVEVKGTVKVDYTDKLKNLYQLARMDVDKKDGGNALKYYEAILIENPTDWEAQFFTEYLKCRHSKIGEIDRSPTAFSSCLESILTLIKLNVTNEKERVEAISVIYDRSEKLFNLLFSASKRLFIEEANKNVYMPVKPDISDMYKASCKKANNESAAEEKFLQNSKAIVSIPIELGDGIDAVFDNKEAKAYAVRAWKLVIDKYMPLAKGGQIDSLNDVVTKHIAKIRKYDASYKSCNLSTTVKQEIIGALRSNNVQLAIKTYRRYTGKGLDEAKDYIEEFVLIHGIKVNYKQAKTGNLGRAEGKIRICGIMGLLPYTFIAGIFALCFVNAAKEENGGSLSDKAKRWLIAGVVGFCVYILLFIALFSSIA